MKGSTDSNRDLMRLGAAFMWGGIICAYGTEGYSRLPACSKSPVWVGSLFQVLKDL